MAHKELNSRQKNVLAIIVEATYITRGKVKGVRNRISGMFLDGRTISALQRRGLIDHRVETINGTGYAATLEGFMEYQNNKRKK